MSHIQNFINTTIIFLLGVLILLTLYIGFLVIWDNHQLPVSLTITDYDKKVIYGNDLHISSATNRLRACTVFSERHFINLKTNEHYDIPANSKAITNVELINMNTTIDLPKIMVPGPYIIQFQWNYYCNPVNYLLGPIVVLPDPIYFEIVPKDPPVTP